MKMLKKAIALILVLCLITAYIPTYSVFAADNGPGQYRVSVTTTLSLRSGPGTSYDRLAYIPDGTLLTVTETSSGWGKTVYNGINGWVSLDYAHYYADNSGNAVSSDQRNDIVKIAQGEVGYKEGSNNYTKYGVWYSSATKNAPWCAIFVSWCAYQVGIPESIIPKFSFCATGITLFKNMGVWKEKANYIPQTGDIIFFRSNSATTASDHVGIVVSCDGTKVYTIEGNSSDAVSKRTYNLTDSYIVGYAAPAYVPAVTTTQSTSTTTTTTTTSSATSATSSETSSTASTTESTTTSSSATSSSSTSSQTTTVSTTAPTQPPAGEQTKLTVTGSVVNVRSDAGTSSSKVAAVRRGMSFDVLGSKKDSAGVEWYMISVNGKTGYIISKYVTISVSAPAADNNGQTAASGLVVVTGTTVNIRSGAGTNNGVLGKARKGEVYVMTGKTTVDGREWYKIEYNGSVGYISGAYSKVIEQVKVTGAVVNVRNGAGTQYTRVGSVRKGQTYKVVGCQMASNNVMWYKISWNGQEVYICSTYARTA